MKKNLTFGILAAGLTTALSAAAADYSWPQWQGLHRDGKSPETDLLDKWPSGGPTKVWMYQNAGLGYSGPAVVGNEMYVLGTRNDKEQLIKIDVSNGQEVWAVALSDVLSNNWGDGPRSTPTVAGDFVYAMSGPGELVCVDRRNGSKKWNVNMEELGGKVPGWGYTESILVDGDKVICTPGGSKGTVAALNASTGDVIWQAKDLTESAHYSSAVVAEINGVRQYIQRTEKAVFGIGASDGKVLWQTDFPGRTAVIPTPVVKGNHVYVTAGYGTGCKMVRIGGDWSVEEVYSNKNMKNHHGGVVLVGDHIYGYSDGVGWMCQDLMTGEEVWSDKEALGKGAIAFADGKLYCLSENDGTLVLINATTDGFQEISRFTISPQSNIRASRGKIWVHPTIVNGRLYLRDQDHIYAYDISST